MEYMVGTEGNSNYLVIAEHEGLSIGVRPLLQPASELQYLIGFRVRIHDNRKPKQVEDVASYLLDHPTMIIWDRANDVRASLVMGGIFPWPFGMTREEFLEKLSLPGTTQALLDRLAWAMNITTPFEEIYSHVETILDPLITKISKAFESHAAPPGYKDVLMGLEQKQKKLYQNSHVTVNQL